jgi:hypothetical protein
MTILKTAAVIVILVWLMCDVTMWGLIFYEHERLIELNRDVGTLYIYLPIHKHESYGRN